MVWNTEAGIPSSSGIRLEFWVGETLELALEDFKHIPAQGEFITYANLAGEEVTHRVGDVTFILREARVATDAADPSPGSASIYLQPTIKIEMQAVP